MFLKLYVFYFNTKIITMNFNELVSISSKTYFGRMSSRLWRYKLISSILFNLHIVFFLNSHGWRPVTFWQISWLHPSPVYHYKYFEFQIQAETETARTIYFSPEIGINLLLMTRTTWNWHYIKCQRCPRGRWCICQRLSQHHITEIRAAFNNEYCSGRSVRVTAAWLAQLVERQSAVREVDGSSPRPDQHSGS